jgi:hypothetical protein
VYRFLLNIELAGLPPQKEERAETLNLLSKNLYTARVDSLTPTTKPSELRSVEQNNRLNHNTQTIKGKSNVRWTRA